MKRVSSRAFQLHMSLYLKELPIVLTHYGKEVAKVESVNTITFPEPSPELTKGLVEEYKRKTAKSVNTSEEGPPIYHGTWLCKKHQSFICNCKQPKGGKK